MPIAGGILVAGTAAHCLSSAAGMFRFLARLSGRRRHVRRSSSGPGGRVGTTRTGPTVSGTTLPALSTVYGDTAAEGTAVLSSSSGRTEEEELEPSGKNGTDQVRSLMAIEPEDCCSNSGATSHRRHLHHHHHHHHHHRHRHYHLEQRHNHHQRRQERLRRDDPASDNVPVNEKSEHEDPRESFLASDPHHLHQHHLTDPSSRHHHQRLHDIHQRLHEDRPTVEDEDLRRERPVDRLAPDSNASASTTVTAMTRGWRFPPYLATLLILSYTLFGIADACSSRSTPKPRPPAPTPRPNITFHMYTCPPDYAEWYCLNGATCFTVKIVDSLLYNCLCANGYIGQRCEFKDLDGSYLPSRQRVMLETASIAGGATIAVFLVVIICIAAYIHCKRKQKELRTSSNGVDTVDGPGRDPELRPFSNRNRSLMIFMAKNSNSATLNPTIEQTRMPEWNYPEAESTRMESISEGKRLVTDSAMASRTPESRLPKQR